MSSTRDFLNQLPHATLKALTRKLNLDAGIKDFTKLSRDDLITQLEKRTNYANGKLTVVIPITELELPAKKERKSRVKKESEPKVRKSRTKKEKEQKPAETDINLTAQLASLINTMSAETTNEENQKVDEKQDIIAEAIAEVESIEKDTNITQETKKEEILNVLRDLQDDKPEIDLSVLSQDKKEVNENLDDGLKEFTKSLFQSFYADELDELDSLSFNFGNTDIGPIDIEKEEIEDIPIDIIENKQNTNLTDSEKEKLTQLKFELLKLLENKPKYVLETEEESKKIYDTIFYSTVAKERRGAAKKLVSGSTIKEAKTIKYYDRITELKKQIQEIESPSVKVESIGELIAPKKKLKTSDLLGLDIQEEAPKKIVTAEIDEETGMISVMEEEDTELMEATRNIERMRAQSQNIMKSIQEEPKPALKSYIDELNDQLAELDEMSFNFGLQEIPQMIPEKMASPVQERMPSPPMMEEIPKEKKQISSAPSGEVIEDPGQWIKDNLTPTKRFKTPNEKHRWMYYPREEIDAISDMGVLDYLKDEANTFRNLSQNHTKETLYYIKAAINSIQDRQDALYLNRGRGRPMKGKQAGDKEEVRQKRLTDAFDNLPEPDKTEFYDTIKKIDSDVIDYMRDYAYYESFEDSYKPFTENWKNEKVREYKVNGKDKEIGPYDIIDNMYSFNSDIEDILERNDIDRDTLASWIELHIERKNYLAEFNRLIAREEKIKKRDPKLIQKSATKIQAAARGFLERRKLEREGIEKSQVVKQKQQSAEDKYKEAVSKGGLTKEILAAYLETPKASAKQIMKDVNKFISDMKFKPGTAKTAINRVSKLITEIRSEKAKELYDVEFNRKDFNSWKELLLKQSYASSGTQAKIYDLKKQYKKADETKQTQILEKFAEVYNQQKVERLLTNYNIE